MPRNSDKDPIGVIGPAVDQTGKEDLDGRCSVDATVDETTDEHTFEDSKEGDNGERSQNRHLTLLDGGVINRPSARTGASMSTDFPVVRDASRHDQPLLRYRPQHDLPALASASATWSDLTVQATVEPWAGLTSGWGNTWTVTYRHRNHDLTATVASVSTRDLLVADPVRVNTWHPNKTSRAGLRYLHSTERHHAHESLFERKLLCVLDYANATEVVSQPFTLTWHDGTRTRHHTPDFMAMVEGQVVVFNTRPAELLNDRLREDAAALGEVCLSRGWGHALVVGYPLPAFTTVETVAVHAKDQDRLGYRQAFLDILTDQGPTGFSDLCHQVEGPVYARAVLQRLIWERQVSVDLNRHLEDWSLVSLPDQQVTR